MIGTVTDFTAEAVFASALQPSQQPTPAQVWDAVTDTVTRLGTDGCADRLAAAYGDCMTTAATRMRWARETAGALTLKTVAA
ncbi:hypothetical protein [Pilimelia columellifera]|uniref:Uncharacterized protein n=1 Tax=Pilimelia columellifera subsp. columellifera TaxID=706583 RepID=A0ABN3NRB8_9ACTN